MKKFLLLIILLSSGIVSAQGLFPELAGFEGKQNPNAKPVSRPIKGEIPQTEEGPSPAEEPLPLIGEPADLMTQEEISEALSDGEGTVAVEATEEVDLFKAQSETPTQEASTEEATPEEDEDEEDEAKITIYMEAIRSTMTPNRNFSYCRGVLKFLNTMKRPVQALDVILTYGPYPASFNVRNLIKDKEQAASLTLMGDACERIMDMPEMEIKRCVVEGMSEAKCKKKVEFLPLRGS